MPCEMCGREAPTRRAIVEGTPMKVCSDCTRFGKLVETPAQAARPHLAPQVAEGLARRERRMGGRKDVYDAEQMSLELVTDFGPRIQKAREGKGWTRQDLGARVKEPENAVAQIEAGALHPTDVTARRLEKALGIKLFERVQRIATTRKATRGLTLGDMLKDALKKDD